MSNNYIISGGKEGKERLNVLAEVLKPSTKALLESEGSISGGRFLDAGCGGGHVAIMAAQMVGADGYALGLDFDSTILELAKKDAEELGLKNIEFKPVDAYKIDFEEEFDIGYARFLLSHLEEPLTVLKNIIKSVKPGGRIIIEDIDFSGHFCYPPSKAFDLYLEYFIKAATNNGHNPNIGLSLYELGKKAGIKDIKFDFVQPHFTNGEGKWMGYYTFDKIKNAVLKQSLCSEEEFTSILDELKEFTLNADSMISLPRVFRISGRK